MPTVQETIQLLQQTINDLEKLDPHLQVKQLVCPSNGPWTRSANGFDVINVRTFVKDLHKEKGAEHVYMEFHYQ